MDQLNSTTNLALRKHFKHLTFAERGMIKALLKQGLKAHAIAFIVGCSYTTVYNEIKRGTPHRNGTRGPKPGYNPDYAQKAYEANRLNSHRPLKIADSAVEPFIQWFTYTFHNRYHSIDACVGEAKRQGVFPKAAMLCTKTIYNMLWRKLLPISLFSLPTLLSRKHKRPWVRRNYRLYGRSIEERPAVVSAKTEFGHWEIDTVVGRKKASEAVILTLLEKKTRYYIAIKIAAKSSTAANKAISQLVDSYGEHFSDVFKTITADNGTEFSRLSEIETFGCKVYFAHPYSSSERAQNERHNGLLRKYVSKGKSISQYKGEDILSFADEINALPRRILGYCSPELLFEDELDLVYSA